MLSYKIARFQVSKKCFGIEKKSDSFLITDCMDLRIRLGRDYLHNEKMFAIVPRIFARSMGIRFLQG